MKLTTNQLRQLIETIVSEVEVPPQGSVSDPATVAVLEKLLSMKTQMADLFDELDKLPIKQDPKTGRQLDAAMDNAEKGMRHLRMLLRGDKPKA